MKRSECKPGTRVTMRLYDPRKKTSRLLKGIVQPILFSLPHWSNAVPVYWDEGYESWENVQSLTKEWKEKKNAEEQ